MERLLRQGRGAVNVSLDSASPGVYRAVKGVDAFTRVVEHIRRYAAAACTPGLVHVKYIVFAKNNSVKEIAHFLDLCCSLHVDVVQYSLNFAELNTGSAQATSLLGAAFFTAPCGRTGAAYGTFLHSSGRNGSHWQAGTGTFWRRGSTGIAHLMLLSPLVTMYTRAVRAMLPMRSPLPQEIFSYVQITLARRKVLVY